MIPLKNFNPFQIACDAVFDSEEVLQFEYLGSANPMTTENMEQQHMYNNNNDWSNLHDNMQYHHPQVNENQTIKECENQNGNSKEFAFKERIINICTGK